MARPRDPGKRPSFQWYPGDHRRDTAVQACSFEARACWRELMDLMHDGEPYGHLTAGGVPIVPEQLASMLGVSAAKVRRWLDELESRKIFSRTAAGVIYSRRMVRDEQNRNVRAAGGAASLQNPNVPRPKQLVDSPSDATGRIPSYGPSGVPSADPLAGSFAPSPAVAFAVAEDTSSSTQAKQVDREPRSFRAIARWAGGDPQRRRLLEQCARKAAALGGIASESYLLEECAAVLDGGGTVRLTDSELFDALRQWDASGKPFNLRSFRRWLAGVKEIPSNGQRGTARVSDDEVEAIEVLGQIKALRISERTATGVHEHIPQSSVRQLGEAAFRAYGDIGGATRVLDTPPNQWSYVIRDFTRAYIAAKRSGRRGPRVTSKTRVLAQNNVGGATGC